MATEPSYPVRLSFQYTLDDFLKADGAHQRRSRFNRLLPWGLLVVLGPLVGLFLLGGGPPKLLVPVLTPALALWPGLPILRRFLHREQIRLTPATPGEVVVDLDDEGVRSTTSGSTDVLSWSSLAGWLEDRHVVLVYRDARMYLAIPWRAVPDHERGELRSLLRAHLPELREGRAVVAPTPPPLAASLPPAEGSLLCLRFALTPEELSQAFRRHCAARWMYVIPRALCTIAGVALLLCEGAGLYSEGLASLSGRFPTLLCACVLVLSGPLAHRINLWAYRKAPNMFQDRQVDLTDQGLEVRCAEQATKLAWNVFTRWADDPLVIRLYVGPSVMHLVPTRTLTPEQQARLRALLEERLGPAGRRLAPTPA